MWNYSSSGPVISFEVKLYEGSNRIDFCYRQETNAVNSGSASIGLNGSTAGVFLSLDGSGSNPNVSSTTETTTISTKPATDQVYRWDPITCSGTPTAGTLLVPSSISSCTSPLVLSATGYSMGCGMQYQWQYSSDGSTWSDISGATTIPYTLTSPSIGYYRLKVTCTNSGITNYSPAQYVSGGSSQLSYTFSAVSGTYANISGTTIHGSNVDEAISGWIPIGFTFYYNCQAYTQVKVSSNGWLTFNDLSSSYLTNDLDGTVGNSLLLYGMI